MESIRVHGKRIECMELPEVEHFNMCEAKIVVPWSALESTGVMESLLAKYLVLLAMTTSAYASFFTKENNYVFLLVLYFCHFFESSLTCRVRS